MSIYTIKQSKIIAITLIILLGLFLLYSLQVVFTAILGAVVIYVLFKPLYIFLSEKKKINKALSAVIIIILSFIIIIIPFTGLIWMMVDKIVYYSKNPEHIKQLISTAEKFIGETFDQQTIQDTLNKASTWAVSMLTSFFDTALGIILTIGMMYFFLYFMYTKYEIFEGTLIKYMPFREKNVEHFGKEFNNMTYANIVGQGIIAFAQGAFMGIGFLIFGIPDPLFWSMICFFLSFLPVIGSAGVFVPAGLFELASGDTFSGLGIMIYGFVIVANVDNLLRLWINKWIGNIHPLITITGVVIGIPMFGILGLVFGPLLISLFVLLVRLYEAAYLQKQNEKEKIVKTAEINNDN